MARIADATIQAAILLSGQTQCLDPEKRTRGFDFLGMEYSGPRESPAQRKYGTLSPGVRVNIGGFPTG